MNFHLESNETAARYVAKRLDESELERFEQHLLVCESCRNEVRLAELLRSELPQNDRIRSNWLAGAALAIAATLAVVFLRTDTRSLVKLGEVTTAPSYGAVPVRAAASQGDSTFATAMASYSAGAYDESAEKLEAARSAGADSVTTTFFLGASKLMAGKATDATGEFQRAARMGSTLYSAESRYYAAKAWLQAGKKNEALRELDAAISTDGPVRARATSLADSVRALR